MAQIRNKAAKVLTEVFLEENRETAYLLQWWMKEKNIKNLTIDVELAFIKYIKDMNDFIEKSEIKAEEYELQEIMNQDNY